MYNCSYFIIQSGKNIARRDIIDSYSDEELVGVIDSITTYSNKHDYTANIPLYT